MAPGRILTERTGVLETAMENIMRFIFILLTGCSTPMAPQQQDPSTFAILPDPACAACLVEECVECVGGWKAKHIVIDEEDISILDHLGRYVEVSGNMASGTYSLDDPEYDAVSNPHPFRMSAAFGSGGAAASVQCGLVDEYGMRGEIACWGPSNDATTSPPTGTYSFIDGNSQSYPAFCAIDATDGSIVTWGDSRNDAVGTEPSGTGFTTCAVGEGQIMCATGQTNGGAVCWGNTGDIDTSGTYALPTTGTYVDIELAWTKLGGLIEDDGTLSFFGDGDYAVLQRAVDRAPVLTAGASDLEMSAWRTYVVLDSNGIAHAWSSHSATDDVIMTAPISYSDAYAQMHASPLEKYNAKSPFALSEIRVEGFNICGIIATEPTEPVYSLSLYGGTDEVENIQKGRILCFGEYVDHGNQHAKVIFDPCE